MFGFGYYVWHWNLNVLVSAVNIRIKSFVDVLFSVVLFSSYFISAGDVGHFFFSLYLSSAYLSRPSLYLMLCLACLRTCLPHYNTTPPQPQHHTSSRVLAGVTLDISRVSFTVPGQFLIEIDWRISVKISSPTFFEFPRTHTSYKKQTAKTNIQGNACA